MLLGQINAFHMNVTSISHHMVEISAVSPLAVGKVVFFFCHGFHKWNSDDSSQLDSVHHHHHPHHHLPQTGSTWAQVSERLSHSTTLIFNNFRYIYICIHHSYYSMCNVSKALLRTSIIKGWREVWPVILAYWIWSLRQKLSGDNVETDRGN